MKSPFKFLDSYTKDDREIFFGREREIEELYHRVFESKIMLVYGVSGTGKSSLINCGLSNKFSETDWLPLNIRRGGNILDSLAAAIKSASITKQTGELVTPSQFKKSVRSLYLDHYKPIFFIFDQFEELFIFGNKEEKKAVVQVIKALVESEIQCRFIFVMREEYMAGITEFERSIPTIFANRVRIEKMAHINAIEAIKGPCRVAQIDIEEGFAEALLEKLSPESADVELTYLQVFLDRILRLASQTGGENTNLNLNLNLTFTIPLLSRVGNVSDLLGSFLEEQLKELDEPDTGLTILKSFVSVKGTKKQLTEREVISTSRAYGKNIPEPIVLGLLQKFVNIRILRDKDDNGRYELRHDSLALKIFEKITIVEKELMEIYQFLENAYTAFEKRKVLLNANDLKYIGPYEDRLFVKKEIGVFIEQSKQVTEKIRKRIKRIAIAGFFAILTFSVGTIFWTLHWPFSRPIRYVGFFVYGFWFLPLFGYYALKTKENRTINLLFLVFTLLFLGNLFLYNTIIKSRLRYSLNYPVRLTNAIVSADKEKIDLRTKNIYDSIYIKTKSSSMSGGEFKETANKVKERTDEVVNYLQDLKIELINLSEGEGSPAINGKEVNITRIIKLEENNLPSVILIGANADGKAFILRALLNNYKAFLSELVSNDSLIVKGFDIALKLNDRNIVRPDGTIKKERWENYNFQAVSMGFTILRLSQMQNEVRSCESEVLSYLLDKMNEELRQKKIKQ